jgi:hypothetical protein
MYERHLNALQYIWLHFFIQFVSIPDIKKLFSFIRLYVTVILSLEVFLLSSKRFDFVCLNGAATKSPTCSFFALGENLVKPGECKKYFFCKISNIFSK